MPATNDDLLAELQRITEGIEKLADVIGGAAGGGGAGGGPGAAGQGASGRAKAGGGGLASFKGYLAAAESGLGAGVEIADRTGILAGIRTGQLGGDREAVLGSVAQRATRELTQTTLGGALFARTAQVAGREQEAISGVAGFAQAAALGGARLDDETIRQALERQKEVSKIRQEEFLRVEQIARRGAAAERGEALRLDIEGLEKAGRAAVELATRFNSLSALLANLPGVSGAR